MHVLAALPGWQLFLVHAGSSPVECGVTVAGRSNPSSEASSHVSTLSDSRDTVARSTRDEALSDLYLRLRADEVATDLMEEWAWKIMKISRS